MSRARTLASILGSDGALNAGDVSGLAAVATSGSAADLSTGTLPIARIADGAVTAAKLANGGLELADKNSIVNGSLSVWQRGTSWTRAQVSNAEFVADRFWVYGYSASSGTIDRSTDVPTGEGFLYSLANNLDASVPYGTNVELLAQGNAAPFAVNKNYTLSFWIKGAGAVSNLSMGISWRNQHADGTNSTQAVATNPTYNVTTSWTRVVIPFTLTTSPHANNRVLDFETTFPAGAKVTGWKLEPGSVVTPFVHRLVGTEMALCHRYTYVLGSGIDTNWGIGRWEGTAALIQIVYPQVMRALPSFTLVNAAGLQLVYPEVAWYNVTSLLGVHKNGTRSADLNFGTAIAGGTVPGKTFSQLAANSGSPSLVVAAEL